MAVNKVVFNTADGEQTLIDLTGDSVTPETLAEGITAHDASGERIVGTMQAGEGGGGSGESAIDEFLQTGISGAYKNDTMIGVREYAFAGCGNLTSADFANVTSISALAFARCYELSVLVLRTTQYACVLGEDATATFMETKIQYGQGIILVPRDLIDAYQSELFWEEFADYFRALEDYTVDGTVSGEIDWDLVEEELSSMVAEYAVLIKNPDTTGAFDQIDSIIGVPGTPWAEWVNSDYNSAFELTDDGMYVLYMGQAYVTFPDGMMVPSDAPIDMFDGAVYVTLIDDAYPPE